MPVTSVIAKKKERTKKIHAKHKDSETPGLLKQENKEAWERKKKLKKLAKKNKRKSKK